MFIRTAAAVATAVVLAVSGCSGTSETTEDTADESASTAGLTDWADGVCSAADAVEASLDDIGSSLEVDLGSSDAVRDQLGEQVRTQAEAARDDVRDLAAAISSVPTGSDAEVEAAVAQLQEDQQTLQESIDELRVTASGLADAENVGALASEIGAVGAGLAQTRTDAAAFAAGLRALAETGSESIRAAIAEAPACSARTAAG